MTPISRGTASRLGLRKPVRYWKRGVPQWIIDWNLNISQQQEDAFEWLAVWLTERRKAERAP